MNAIVLSGASPSDSFSDSSGYRSFVPPPFCIPLWPPPCQSQFRISGSCSGRNSGLSVWRSPSVFWRMGLQTLYRQPRTSAYFSRYADCHSYQPPGRTAYAFDHTFSRVARFLTASVFTGGQFLPGIIVISVKLLCV